MRRSSRELLKTMAAFEDSYQLCIHNYVNKSLKTKINMKKATLALKLFAVLVTLLAFIGCGNNKAESVANNRDSSMLSSDKLSETNDQEVARNLATFDTLDFNIFSRRDWARFHESHDQNIKVYFPDGHTTEGLDVHIKDMDAMFVYAPDTRITVHPIKIGSGNITAVTGIMEGTFTKPMPLGNGKFIQPTGKAFKLPMATFGIWKNGVMVEEHLYWDNKTYMQQMGIGQ
jgi:hypothetical protein